MEDTETRRTFSDAASKDLALILAKLAAYGLDQRGVVDSLRALVGAEQQQEILGASLNTDPEIPGLPFTG